MFRIWLIALQLAVPPPAPPTPADAPSFVAPDTIRVEATRAPWDRMPSLLLARPRTGPSTAATRPALPSRPPGLERERVTLSPFARTMFAADRGANAGLMIGGLGNFLGLWSEDTAYAIMGAGAALGAVLNAAAGPPPPAGGP